MLSIGDLKLPSPLVLAPMAGISDLPYRLVNRSLGCGLAFTEMISSNSLVYKSKNTLKMLSADIEDRPLAVQILGNDCETIKRALDVLSDYTFDMIDFNAACPAPKVVSSGKGSALMKDLSKLQKLLKVIIENTSLPVTVKIRAGWSETSVNAVEAALCAEDAGVKGVTIHGRTRLQGYRGQVDYNIIRKVKESIRIPVIASGDAFSPGLIKKLFDETGCDGVAVARGALGNPWIFRATAEYMSKGTEPLNPDILEKTQTMKKHLLLNTQFHGEEKGVMLFRKFFGWYVKGMAVKGLKEKAFHAVTQDNMLGLIEELLTSPNKYQPASAIK